MRAMKLKPFLSLALLVSGVLFGCSTSNSQLTGLPIRYHNAQYGLTFYLPTDWRGYSVLTSQWAGESYIPEKDKVVISSRGPLITLRNPQWKSQRPYQDIPIYVFTRRQWDDIQAGKIGEPVGAGGIIYELWHNGKFVYGIHSRYNANDSVEGWNEAQDILNRNCAAHPEPHLRDA